MRVQYTLPGFLPDPAPSLEGMEAGESLFQNKLAAPVANTRTEWSRLLRLDLPPAGSAQIGPPPAPPGLQVADAASERLRWRQMLDRRIQSFEDSSEGGGESEPLPVRRMLARLLKYQDLQDDVAARHLAEAEG